MAMTHGTSDTSVEQLKRKWALRSPRDLRERYRELGSGDYLIEGLIPTRKIGLMVGDSGLGKSPLLYQMALCVATGAPFLGLSVRRGRVVYLDFENGLADSSELVERLAAHLKVSEADWKSNFLVWNLNDCSPNYGRAGHTALDIIRDTKPVLAIVDSLGSYYPEVEEKNSAAVRTIQEFREVIRDCGSSFLAVHHIRKPSNKPDEMPDSLEKGNLHQWFLQARGARALINASDVRLGVDVPERGIEGQTGLILRGFGRVRGEIGPYYLSRILDDEGDPVGYCRRVGVDLLFNREQEACFRALPQSFRTKDARQAYGKGHQATRDFLDKCIRAGILRQVARGTYEKV